MAVITDHRLGDIWQHEDGLFQAVADRKLSWMTAPEQARAERLRQAKLIWTGRHFQYFVTENRSAFSYPALKANQPPFYVPFNLLGLCTKKTADLLFGESPRVHVKDQRVQESINQIMARSSMAAMLIGAAKAASWAGEAYLEITRVAGQVYVAHIEPDTIWPLGMRGPDRQYSAFVRYATQTIRKSPQAPAITLLLETRYTPGLITRRLYKLAQGDLVDLHRIDELGLEHWPWRDANENPLPASESTGLSRCSIIAVPNEEGAMSDYDGLLEHQDTVNAKNTQIARVLAKHADPKLAAPASSADDKGNLPAAAEVHFFRSKEEIPQYITWNAELSAAIEDRRFAVNALCMTAEMSQVLLGLKEGAAPDAARKLRLEATNSLAKAQRKAVYWQSGIAQAMALALEADGFGPAANLLPNIGVEMRDGLPDDELDRAQVVATLRSAGVMSRRRGLRQQWLDEPSVEDELTELNEEIQQATPSMLLDEPGETSPGNAGQGIDTVPAVATPEDQSDAVASNDLRATVGGSQAIRELQRLYYQGELPRDATIANARIVFGFTDEEASDLFPAIAPDAPGNQGQTTPTDDM